MHTPRIAAKSCFAEKHFGNAVNSRKSTSGRLLHKDNYSIVRVNKFIQQITLQMIEKSLVTDIW